MRELGPASLIGAERQRVTLQGSNGREPVAGDRLPTTAAATPVSMAGRRRDYPCPHISPGKTDMRGTMLALMVLSLTGCGLNTQFVHLDPPGTDRVVGALKPVVIESVVDARDFATLPEDNQPRLAPKIASELGPARRARAVSGFPRGGKVVLLDDRTVPDAIRDVVVASLRGHGYEAVAADQAPADAPRLAVRVTEFWSCLPFSFGRSLTWTMQLKAWATTEITVKTPTLERQFTVKGYGAHIVQAYKLENVRQAYDLALADYQRNLDARLYGSL